MGDDGAITTRLLKAKVRAVSSFLPRTRERVFSARAFSGRPQMNVVGVGIGRKIVRGKAGSSLAVRIYVEKKHPKWMVPEQYLLPREIGGVPTDVVETGRFQAFLPRYRPIRPGSSVGPPPFEGFLYSGTLGAIVEREGSRFILSNNHVLANEGRLRKGTAIYQPSLADGGGRNRDMVARLSEFVPLARGENRVDCAIAKIVTGARSRGVFLPRVGTLSGRVPVRAFEDMRVHKVGRTTGYTRGVVFDASADVNVEYDMGVLRFTEQMLVRSEGRGPFSQAGDSGSVIVDRASRRACGLLFAGSDEFTVANHLGLVLRKLRVRLVV